MSIRLRALVAVAGAALTLAPAAHAATVPVSPGGLQAAVDAAADGDTLQLAAGDYGETVTIPAAKTGLTLDGASGARLVGPLTVEAPGTVLRTVTLAPAAGGLTVAAGGAASLDRVLAARTAGGDMPVISSAGTLALADSTVATTTGSGLAVTGPSTTIVRSTVATVLGTADAVQVSSASTGDRALVADSSLFVGGAAGGAGIRASTSGASVILPPPLGSVIGDVAITLRHVTVAGASSGLALASGASISGGGIAATAAGSVVHPASTISSSQLGGAPATLTTTDSDGPGLQQDTPDPRLFAPGYKLRADSPAIGKGGPLGDGESTTDLAGAARPAQGGDMGAFQFVNRAPTTGLTLSSGVVDEGATVTAALTPGDPDLGDGVGAYAVDWGDGTSSVGQAPTATHVYARPGVYTVKGAVVDRRSTPSNVATGVVTVRDVSAPQVALTNPRNGQRLRFQRKRRLTLRGTDSDSTGVAKVEVALTRTVRKRCLQYGTRFRRAACSKPVFKRAKLSGETWSLPLRRGVVLRRGTYTVRIRSVDGSGNATATPSRAAGALARFTVR